MTSLMGLKQTLAFYSIVITVVMYAIMSATDLPGLTSIPMIQAQLQQRFMAKLGGQYEVPVKHTRAIGTFELQLIVREPSNYVLNLTGISNVTLVHIHQGANGENGPIIVTLY